MFVVWVEFFKIYNVQDLNFDNLVSVINPPDMIIILHCQNIV